MLKNLMNKLEEYNDKSLREHFPCPSRLTDPIAQKTAWYPLTKGGPNIRCYRWEKPNPDRMELHFTAGWLLKIIAFVLFFVVIGGIYGSLNADDPSFFMAFTAMATLIFVVVLKGAAPRSPMVFDLSTGYFRRDETESMKTDYEEDRHATDLPLGQIHALQLLEAVGESNSSRHHHTSHSEKGRSIHSHRSTFIYSEVNFVLQDGTRLQFYQEGGETSLVQQEIEELADFLGVPFWKGD